MKTWINLFFGICIIVGIQSCGSKKAIQLDNLPNLEEERLIHVLDSISKSTPSFLSSKIDTKYSDNKQNLSFKTSLKIQKDSATNALISFAGIPIITAMITTDSVKVSNKKEKCYILEDLNFFKTQFGIDFSYSNLEELLLGRPVNFNLKNEYFVIEDPYNYVVSTQKESKDEGKLLFTYYLSEDLKHLKRVEIISFKDEVTINISYPLFTIDPLFSSPKNINVDIKSPKNEMKLTMVYEKVELNEPKELIIVIPESYGRCK